MKKLLLLLLILPVMATAQNQFNVFGLVDSVDGSTSMADHSFAGTANDTLLLEPIYVAHYKTIYFGIQAADSVTFLIDYALSYDGTNYTAFTLKDSLSHATSGYGIKSVDLTSTVLGAPWFKIRLRTSALAFALGTTSPTFRPYYTLKRY